MWPHNTAGEKSDYKNDVPLLSQKVRACVLHTQHQMAIGDPNTRSFQCHLGVMLEVKVTLKEYGLMGMKKQNKINNKNK